MRLKFLKGDIWQVSAMMDGGPGDSQPIPISIRFRLRPSGLEYLKAWAWSCQVPEEESWMLRSWLEEQESEILDLTGGGQN